MPTSSELIATATAQLVADAAKLHLILHGADTVSVPTEGGDVPSIAKLQALIAEQLVTGHASGFVAVVANSAARDLATPTQVDQLLIQSDTKKIYYGTATTPGSWTLHPFQTIADEVSDALTTVSDFGTALGDKMNTDTFVGGEATGIVRTADRLSVIAAFIAANGTSALNVLGVENGVVGVFPLLSNNRAVALVDGVPNHTALANTSRRAQAIGANFVFLNNPRRLVSWGFQGGIGVGILGSGISQTESYYPRAVLSRQQPDREFPDFDHNSIHTTAGNIVKVSSQNSSTMALTANGTILVSGAVSQGVRPLFGSGIDKTQTTLMPVFFNVGGVNKAIRLFDVQDSTTVKHSTAIFVDETEGIWIVTTNPNGAGYGNSLVGAQNIPVKLNAGYSAWSGKIVKKIRCDVTGNIYILFTDGNLYAGGGKNTTGQLNTGGTGALLNPAQIANGVEDFEVSGQEYDTVLSLFVLQGTTLKGAGYNNNGQLGQTGGTSAQNIANKLSFVTISTDVDMVRIGGTDNTTVIFRKTDGTFYGTGRNTDGCLGQGVSVTITNAALSLTNLNDLVDDNDGLVNLVISGYNGKHSSAVVCTNGKAFTAGNNTDGCLANGTLVSTNSWQEILWSPRDASEKIVDVSACVGPSSGPGFTWLTNHGRILMAGSTNYGFANGVKPSVAYSVTVASPVQFGTL